MEDADGSLVPTFNSGFCNMKQCIKSIMVALKHLLLGFPNMVVLIHTLVERPGPGESRVSCLTAQHFSGGYSYNPGQTAETVYQCFNISVCNTKM